MYFNSGFLLAGVPLDSLIDLVSQDSEQAYLEALQAFNGRLAGTPSSYAARDWIAAKFSSFGYDSVMTDSFTGVQLGNGDVPCFNVVATKVGSRYPGQHIVIGAHHDAVRDSPGADDNGSGTVGVLEIARVLQGIDTEMTFVFVTFDSEESGLRGAHHYADDATDRGDSIVYMLNMDMIGDSNNVSLAKLFTGVADDSYALLWSKLADSLVGITGVLSGSSGSSDHAAFAQNGYDVTFVHEFMFSTVPE
jgi:hypothetical protein